MEQVERLELTHMEQLIEFPVGTLICHASFPAERIFKVIGWFNNNLEVMAVNPTDPEHPTNTMPYYFAQISDITIVGEAAHEF